MQAYTVQHDGRIYAEMTIGELSGKGVPLAVIGAAVKSVARARITGLADSYRARLASASAGKLAEYRIKEEIARDPDAAAEDELAMLDREAAARGMDRAALLAMISARAGAYRRIALLVGALEAEAGAAISAIPDDAADIETQIQTVLTAAQQQADTAFAEAQALINGGA